MKTLIALTALLLTLSAFAQEAQDCRLHQDYEGQEFEVGATLVPYFEPWDLDQAVVAQRLAGVPADLQAELLKLLVADDLSLVDDLTLEEISFRGETLLRFNVGVGGGNGFYATFAMRDGSYQLLAYVFDGDVEFCHSSVGKN